MRRSSTALLCSGLALLVLAPAASAATAASKNPKSPAPILATAAFPDGSTQRWSASLALFAEVEKGAYQDVSRPDPATFVYDDYTSYRSRKTKTHPARTHTVRCGRITMHAVLTPSDGTGEPVTVARALMPTATLEATQAFGPNGSSPLAGDSRDQRMAYRVAGDFEGIMTDAVFVGDWTAGVLHGWKQFTVHEAPAVAAGTDEATACSHRPGVLSAVTVLLGDGFVG